MTVPKKRTSKTKKSNRKTIWKKKALKKVIRCFLKSRSLQKK
uniref:Ribosomal protein L32 n=1 Tax=Pseudochlorodesmis sp. HV01306a TaxID=2358488 RepID=A0A386AY20_9CHLO|nr:ribosomal protein L32 [Pseudochlorodesmis sp. HV01306a]